MPTSASYSIGLTLVLNLENISEKQLLSVGNIDNTGLQRVAHLLCNISLYKVSQAGKPTGSLLMQD